MLPHPQNPQIDSNKTADGRFTRWPKACPKCGESWRWVEHAFYNPAHNWYSGAASKDTMVTERVNLKCRSCHAEIPCLPLDAGGVR